jgi:iron complex outermembrane receptor protein
VNKIIFLSLSTTLLLLSAELEEVCIECDCVSEVAQKAKTSVDLATTLKQNIPSIDMNRRSAIANDIYIRGQKRDNISVDIDGSKVYGACPNRMDPPISHIIASQIEDIEVIEGPYDVENFGTLSGGVKIKTKKPSEGFSGRIEGGYGGFGFRKVGFDVSGGDERIRALVGYTYEDSKQYKDGNGDKLSKQLEKNVGSSTAMTYRDGDLKAYKKQSATAKIFVKTLEDQELRLSYTANRSDDILYANSKMDAAYDDSNIYSVGYSIDNIGSTYKKADIEYYYSDVDHPMDGKFRVGNMPNMYMTNHLKTSMQGLKLKNSLNLDSYRLTIGLDGSKRMWKGESYMTNRASGAISNQKVSLVKTKTDNSALFAKIDKTAGDFDIQAGLRLDHSTIKADTKKDRDFNSISLNLQTTYHINYQNSIFLGFGVASRVPDARELYATGDISGNANLKQVKNREIDLGYKALYDDFEFKIKGFYSNLDDYIYLRKDGTGYMFDNVDGYSYGGESSLAYFITDELSLNASASYKRGKKKGFANKNLADMAPLRTQVALEYEYMDDSTLTLEMQNSAKWSKVDSDAGEQKLAGWSAYNAKIDHAINKNLDVSIGINNITNKTYIQSNSYVDLTLVGAGGGTTMLLNEMGRFVYMNLTYKF